MVFKSGWWDTMNRDLESLTPLSSHTCGSTVARYVRRGNKGILPGIRLLLLSGIVSERLRCALTDIIPTFHLRIKEI